MSKTAGQVAYEADVAAHPTYYDGTRRKTWDQLGEPERSSWERNPTPRHCPPASTCIEHGPGGPIRLSFQIKVF